MASLLSAPLGVSAQSQSFDDVPSSSPYFPYVEELVNLGITAGCSVTPPLYCPLDFTTREQMAVFMIRLRDSIPGGPTGPTGPAGATGSTGKPGDPGANGADGAT